MSKNIFDFSVLDSTCNTVDLSIFRDQVLLIVNTATGCGFAYQYADLESLYLKYKDQGFTILAFPCNQFGNQEPLTATAVVTHCQLHYSVTFPIYNKIAVNGVKADPLFVFLKDQAAGFLGTGFIKWNFTKFLLNRDGKVIQRFSPNTAVSKIETSLLNII